MPNVLQLLNHDHREVEGLFAHFESTEDFQTALKICEELTVHAEVEEEIVYPVLAEIDRPIEREAEEEHAEAKRLIARIQGMAPSDPQLVPTVMELKGAVEHHVEEEEHEAWPKMERGASGRLDELGRRVEQRKQELASAPAPVTEVRGRGRSDLDSMTKDELYRMAQEREIEGRSSMKKAELVRALSKG